jgi:competence protein ComEA
MSRHIDPSADASTFRIGVLLVLGFCVLILSCSAETRGPVDRPEKISAAAERSININTASAADLQTIPHFGEKMAMKIIEHRRRYGPFRRPEHLMLIDGIGDRRFREIRHLVRVE